MKKSVMRNAKANSTSPFPNQPLLKEKGTKVTVGNSDS
jgi:hypothetical protein